MKKRKNHRTLYRTACACLAAGVVCQTSIPTIYAASGQTYTPSVSTSAVYSLKDDFSKHGNPVTEYHNEESNQLRTILWTQGITPPQMGGDHSQFQRELTYDNNGNIIYINYNAPYLPGNGWYDVNKSTNFEQNDVNLCFAAAAANSLHWWMDRNSSNIDRYLDKNPDNTQIQKLEHLRSSYQDQQHSGVYNIFRDQFKGKPDGYWSDLLQDQFLNGYYLSSSGGTNDSAAAQNKLQTEGPDKHGGFFYEAFGIDRLSERRYYDWGFDALNRELKELLLGGNLVLLTYSVGANAHVVTVWGAEFDQSGNIQAVYFSDSDDTANQGMVRYRLVNINGRPAVTTRTDGTSSNFVTCLQILSPGTQLWDRYFQDPKTTLNLEWSDTELVYNGQMQAPTVSANNIAPGDDITLSVEGGAINAGSYTATVVLSGSSADKYELPSEHTLTYEIKKAPAPVITYPSAGVLQYGQQLSDSILSGGSTEFGQFTWADPSIVPLVNNPGYPVTFVPSETTKQNYEVETSSSTIIPVTVHKATPSVTLDADVTNEDGSNAIALTASLATSGLGKVPSGTVTFTILDETGSAVIDTLSNIAVVNGTAVTTLTDVIPATYTVTASYAGDENYNAVSSNTMTVDVSKQSQSGFQILPIDAKTYGDETFTLSTSGGNGSGVITYESSDPSVISIFGNTVTIHKAGSATITAKKAGDALYNEASATCPIVVNKRDIRVIANSQSDVIQGDALPQLTYSVEGLVNGDQLTDVTLSVSIENTDVPGDYSIFVTGGNLTNAESYNVTYVTGTLSIQAKELPPVPSEPSEPSKPNVPTEPEVNNKPGHQENAGVTPPAPAQPPATPIAPENSSSSENKPTSGENTEGPVTQTETSDAQAPDEATPEEEQFTPTLPDTETDPEKNFSDSVVSDENTTKPKHNIVHVVVVIVISLLILLISGITIAYAIWRKKEQNRRKRTKTH